MPLSLYQLYIDIEQVHLKSFQASWKISSLSGNSKDCMELTKLFVRGGTLKLEQALHIEIQKLPTKCESSRLSFRNQ